MNMLRLVCSVCGFQSNQVPAGYCPESESYLGKPTWYVPLFSYDDERLDYVPVCISTDYGNDALAMTIFERWLVKNAESVIEGMTGSVIFPIPQVLAEGIRQCHDWVRCPRCDKIVDFVYQRKEN